MSNKIEVFLSQKELEQLISKKKKIGQGREGKIYRVGDGLLFKIYYKLSPHEREEIVHIPIREYEIDEDGVKRVKEDSSSKIDIEKVVTLNPYYMDYDGVKKVYSIDQIDAAVKRQKNVKHSSLPLGAIYIDNRLGGVVLKEHRGYFDLHMITFLPRKKRLEILKEVLIKLKELCDNNIYPTDLNIKDDDAEHPHINIIINIKGNVEFIDLEGKSTDYTHKADNNLEMASYSEFYFLFLDIIYNEILPADYEEKDISFAEYSLERKGLDKEYIKYLRRWDDLNYDTLENLISNSAKQKTLKSNSK